jgi:hypothetical protein
VPDQIDIVLPGLFDLPLYELDPALVSGQLAGLDQILRLATPRPNNAYSIDAILRPVLKLGEDGDRGLPLAQACAGPQVQRRERLLLAQAVHLRADLQSAVVVPIELSDRTLEEIDILIKDLSDIFNAECNVTVLSGGRYLMELKTLGAPTHYPHILSVLGKTANPYIEQTREDLAWYRLVNEMQMFLYQHEVNRERAERGALPINSLWFWGGGEPPGPPAEKTGWYCDDALLNRFAESRGLSPAALDRVADTPPSAGAVVVDLRLLEMLKTGAETGLEAVLLDIDRQLLQPLLEAAGSSRMPLVLHAGYEFDFYLAPSSRWKFWRPPRSLADWVARDENP